MAPQGEETAAVEVGHEQQQDDDDDKVEIPAPPSPEMDSEKKDNNADDDGKKDTQRKMTVAADAPWSARMVRTQCCCEFCLFGFSGRCCSSSD